MKIRLCENFTSEIFYRQKIKIPIYGSSLSEGYSSKWLIWPMCMEPLVKAKCTLFPKAINIIIIVTVFIQKVATLGHTKLSERSSSHPQIVAAHMLEHS